MNTGSVLFPSRSPTSSRPQSSLSSYDDYPNQPYNDHPHNRLSRPPTNGRHAYPHQPFPLNPSPRHYLYPPYAQNPPPPLRPSTLPPPPSFDDPAFSSDPRANPHFAMNTAEQFIPLNPAAANIVSSSCHHQRPSSHPISFLTTLVRLLSKTLPFLLKTTISFVTPEIPRPVPRISLKDYPTKSPLPPLQGSNLVPTLPITPTMLSHSSPFHSPRLQCQSSQSVIASQPTPICVTRIFYRPTTTSMTLLQILPVPLHRIPPVPVLVPFSLPLPLPRLPALPNYVQGCV